MRPTNEISDPVWQDIWDRDEHIADLTARLAAAEAAARWWRMAARGYILAEGEVHPDERWPWLVDEAADEAAKAGGCDA